MIPRQTELRFTALANRWHSDTADAPDRLMAGAKEAEAAGYDLISYADMVVGDVVPPLLLAAQATNSIGLMTRITCAFTRSPVLLASATAWLDRISRGRFILGLGPSLEWEVRGMHGEPFEHPARRMLEVTLAIRALWGEDLPGFERNADRSINYRGRIIQLEKAGVDLIPAVRPKILIAAAGPRMLQVAGQVADGVIVERVTPRFLEWAWEQIGIGAARAGRTLDGFELCAQTSWVDPNDPKMVDASVRSQIMYANFPEWDQVSDVSGIGDEMRAIKRADALGDRTAVERIVRDSIWPVTGVLCRLPDSPDRFRRWIEQLVKRGVSILALPDDLPGLIGISVTQAKRIAQEAIERRKEE